METFSASLAICAGNSPVPGEFPTQRPVTQSFDVFFDLRLNKRLSKQWWGWWFQMLSHPFWCHCNLRWHHDIQQRTGSALFFKVTKCQMPNRHQTERHLGILLNTQASLMHSPSVPKFLSACSCQLKQPEGRKRGIFCRASLKVNAQSLESIWE